MGQAIGSVGNALARRAVRIAAVVTACTASTLLVFQTQALNGFATLFNDPWDGRIEVALLEHWWNVVRGFEPWQAPPWFSPAADTLGYNDGYLLFGLLHVVFRWCGFDPFLSAELVTLVVRAFGFPGFLLLAHGGLRLAFWPSLLGAVLFTCADNMVAQVDHAQLMTVSLAPWLCWLACRCYAALPHRKAAALAWGLAAAALFDLWLMTAFYTLWFTILFLVILAACRPSWLRQNARRIVAWPVAASLALLSAGTVPFLGTYLPTRHETGGHRFNEVLALAPTLRDMVDLGVGNLLWGRLAVGARAALGWTMTATGEHAVGWPPVLLIVAACGLAVALFRRDRFWAALGVATMFAALLPMVWGQGQWTGWSLVYAIVPGASAIRATTRFALVLTVPVTLLAVYALQGFRASRVLLAGLAALLLVEEINLSPERTWPRRAFLADLAVPPPPDLCKHFIALRPRDGDAIAPSILMNVEAMLIAERLHLPTLNGYASFLPRYQDLSYGQQTEYDARMATLAIHGEVAAGLCTLDLRTGSWALFHVPEMAAPVLGRPYRVSDEAGAGFISGRGWSLPEAEGRWVEGDTGVLIFRNPKPDHPLRLELKAKGYPVANPRAATLSYEGIEVARWFPGEPARTMVAEFPPRPDGLMRVTIHIDHPRSPASLGLGSDTRVLGLFVEAIAVSDPAD